MLDPDDELYNSNDVFISYAHADGGKNQLTADMLGGWLRSLGYDVWWDRSLLAGDYWLQALVQKAINAKRVIVLWSPQAAKRDWVLTEARIGAGIGKLIPLVIEDHPFPAEWGQVQYKKIENLGGEKDYILKALRLKPSGPEMRQAKDDTRVSIAALPTASGALIGRGAELAMLQKAWASTAPGADPAQKTNIVVLHAIGGAGKTALMRTFVDGLADTDFAGADKVFGWSAYSQGSGDNKTANADEVIVRALGFFGHNLARHPIQDPVERGRKLAHLFGERRCLLILDGLEPLQDLPLVNGGRLKDRGLAALVKELAAHNRGLVVITSRQELPELAASKRPRVIGHPLERLDKPAGVALLAHLGVHGKQSEMEAAVEDVLGHALALNLLGTYLDAVYGGDVNQREHFKLGEIEDAPADYIGDQTARFAKRAARIMEGTIARFEAMAGGDGAETAILHIVGLFDRPAEKVALDALLAEPPIPGLTDAFHALATHQRCARWNVAVDRLRKLRLLNAEDPREPGSLDAHPIVRAHFGSWLKHHAPEAFREAHSRLYDFYRYQGLPQAFSSPEAYGLLVMAAAKPDEPIKEAALKLANGALSDEIKDFWPPSHPLWKSEPLREAAALIGTAAFDEALQKFLPSDLNGMRPCFSAIAHGCAADRHQETYSEVYFPRVRRGYQSYILGKLGALNADLAALAAFYQSLWNEPAKKLSEETKAEVFAHTGFALRALGRLREAIVPFEGSLRLHTAMRDWTNATFNACNISELHLRHGDIAEAIRMARTGIARSNESKVLFMMAYSGSALAEALYQAGQAVEAKTVSTEADALHATASKLRSGFQLQPHQLRSYVGSLIQHRVSDFLLSQGLVSAVIDGKRSSKDVAWNDDIYPLSFALANLRLGRAYATLAAETSPPCNEHVLSARSHLGAAMEGFRRAGDDIYLPLGLLARGAFHRNLGEFQAAAADLDEVNEIADRGEMRLYLTDYRLETARLLLAQIEAAREAVEAQEIRARAEEHYAGAKELIEDTGYKRRLPELEAIRACLDGEVPASILDPDRNGRPAAAV